MYKKKPFGTKQDLGAAQEAASIWANEHFGLGQQQPQGFNPAIQAAQTALLGGAVQGVADEWRPRPTPWGAQQEALYMSPIQGAPKLKPGAKNAGEVPLYLSSLVEALGG